MEIDSVGNPTEEAEQARIAERNRYDFDRDAYISLADEFDPMGAWGPAPSLDDFDSAAVQAAQRYSQRHGIPLPWVVGSLDRALELVARADYNEAEDARISRKMADAYPSWEEAFTRMDNELR